MQRHALQFVIALAGLSLIQAGCSVLRPQPDRTRFFVLEPVAAADAGAPPTAHAIALGLGPVTFPGYLDRPQLVRRVSPHQIAISELDHWAEPVQATFTNVLQHDLLTRLNVSGISTSPWPAGAPLDYEVQVDVLHFEATTDGTAELADRWTVRNSKTKQALLVRDADVKRLSASATTEGAVAALSETVGALSQDIADALQQLETQRRASGREKPKPPGQ